MTRNTLLVIAGCLVAACAKPPMLKATAEFSDAAHASLQELSTGSSLAGTLCRQSAEIHYITGAAGITKSFHEYYNQELTADGITEAKLCAQYRALSSGFDTGISALTEYADVLGGIANDADTSSNKFSDLTGSVSGALGKVSNKKLSAYADAIGGLGGALDQLKDTFTQHWEAKKLRDVVKKTDAPVQTTISALIAFLNVLRKEQLLAAREALEAWRAPMVTSSSDRLLVRTLAASVDAEITHRLDRYDRKLGALIELLQGLSRAHTTLRKGWEDENLSKVSITTIKTLSVEIYKSVKSFQNPDQDEGQ
jgi:hypothetical protein